MPAKSVKEEDTPLPSKGSAKKHTWKKRPVCPNCTYEFEDADNYCPSCGQRNTTHKRPVRYFIREFFEELLSLDTRAFTTLHNLVLAPGLLTKNYNADKRALYTAPLRFYVLTSVLFFLSVSWMTQSSIRKSDAELKTALQPSDSLFSDMNATLFWSLELGPADFEALQKLDDYTMESVDSVLTAQGKQTNWLNTKLLLGITPLLSGQFSLEQYYSKLLRNLSYALFFFMPMLALIFKFLYIRRNQFYTEHLIFSVHLHTFSFLLITVWLWIDYMQDYFSIAPWSMICIMIYMAVAMKKVYEQGWFRTLLKGTIAFWSYVILVTLGFSLLLLLSLF